MYTYKASYIWPKDHYWNPGFCGLICEWFVCIMWSEIILTTRSMLTDWMGVNSWNCDEKKIWRLTIKWLYKEPDLWLYWIISFFCDFVFMVINVCYLHLSTFFLKVRICQTQKSDGLSPTDCLHYSHMSQHIPNSDGAGKNSHWGCSFSECKIKPIEKKKHQNFNSVWHAASTHFKGTQAQFESKISNFIFFPIFYV